MNGMATMRAAAKVGLIASALALCACSAGDYSGAPTGNTTGSDPSGGGAATCAELFSQRVQPRLEFCRNCHVPQGIADTPDGHLFQLTTNHADDLSSLRASWDALGRNDGGKSRILKMASGTDTRSHSGGVPWPVGSDGYRAMDALLAGFVEPAACTAGGTGNAPEEAALVGSKKSNHVWADYCATRADDALLPPDPRKSIVAGVNAGKAVVFNAYWKDCHNAIAAPTTCGEYRGLVARGELVGEGQGRPGSATMFSASKSVTDYSIAASDYNTLWQVWGLPGRPENFDALVAERHGSPLSPTRNPYPLPGENPNATDGGTGQLPLVYTQLRAADGTWTGNIGVKFCAFCHNGQLGNAGDGPGLGPQYGGAGSIGDFEVALRDLSIAGRSTTFAETSGVVNIASNRGTGAIDQFQLGFALFANGDPRLLPFPEMINSAAIGTIKSPPWWNMANRPQKFHGAILAMDSSRIDMAAYYPLATNAADGAAAVEWVDANDVPFQAWAESLAAPAYPGPIDFALAQQGAILFHSKNLWEASLHNPVPEPQGGNGSCAGCHGVYSPRYANDPAYLDSPALEGIAARVEPLNIIGTDPVYASAIQSLKRSDGTVNPVIYDNVLLYCGLGQEADTTTPKMLAPPLYGICEERPPMWKRVSAPAPAGLAVVMGFDTNLQRAYDFDKLGWKYDVVNCGDSGTTPLIDCDPLDPNAAPPLADLTALLYKNFWFLWNLPVETPPPFTDQQVENRKVYNTHLYSQGNQGHAFTSVLTDPERRAILEYLKTL
jgi:hypothetical protein